METLISAEEYLAMNFPDREPEYVRGELKERPIPDAIHADIQARLMSLLWGAGDRHGLLVRAAVRCEVGPGVYRLPDVALFARSPYERVPATPCVMAAEIVSRDEQRVALVEKLRDYTSWGVRNIWIIDPWLRGLGVWENDREIPVDALALPDYGFEVRLEQLIEGLPL
jgi:Uma2 family endonuclease